MGCDIHGWVEAYDEDTKKWLALCDINKEYDWNSIPDSLSRKIYPRRRNYQLFAALAGVRGEGPEPRGVPADVTATVQQEINEWGVDGHSHTWIPMMEAWHHWRHYQDLTGLQLDPRHYFIRDPLLEKLVDGDCSNARLILWFDN